METEHSKAHNVGYMGICHGDDPDVTCKRCGILCCYVENIQERCWQERFGKAYKEPRKCEEGFF